MVSECYVSCFIIYEDSLVCTLFISPVSIKIFNSLYVAILCKSGPRGLHSFFAATKPLSLGQMVYKGV